MTPRGTDWSLALLVALGLATGLSTWFAGSRQSAWVFAAHAALEEPGALSRTVTLSYGEESAEGYANQVAGDVLIHSWDLARGIGADVIVRGSSAASARAALRCSAVSSTE